MAACDPPAPSAPGPSGHRDTPASARPIHPSRSHTPAPPTPPVTNAPPPAPEWGSGLGRSLLGFSLATRLEEGLWDPDECAVFDLSGLLQQVAARFQVLAREKGVALEHAHPDAPIQAFGDPILVERALSNLIYNALHHNKAGGHVAILLQHDAEAGTFAFKIMDDGPGVPPAALPQLSMRHYRSDKTRERESTGQGLGLAITAEICRRLQWQLAFETLSPRGLCAVISGALWGGAS